MRNNLDDLEAILRCPVCRSQVRIEDRRVWCASRECRRSYPIDDNDIAHMLESEATIEPLREEGQGPAQ